MRARRLLAPAVRVLGSRWFVLGVIVVGCVLRIAQYLSGRSLWLDEALLSLNIIHRPFAELFRTLYYVQGAPPGFLLLERLAVDVFGSSEAALRLVPLLAGLAALPLFFVASSQLLGRAGAGAALALFAVFEGPVIYSSEVKQYSTDVCWTLAVLAAGLAVERRRLGRREIACFALLGAVAVWFSHAVIFVLLGVLLSLLVGAAWARDRSRTGRLLVVGAAWAASFGAVYIVNVSRLPKGLGTYFLPFPPTSGHDVMASFRGFRDLADGELSLHLPVIVGVVAWALIVVGLVAIGSRSLVRLSILVSPVVLTALASGIGDYPWGGRFTLFLVPIVPMLVVAGVQAIAQTRRELAPAFAAVLFAVVAAPALATAAWHLANPLRVEEMAPVVRALESRYRPGDTLYVNTTAQYALRYYALDRSMGARLGLEPSGRRDQAIRPAPAKLVIGPDTADPARVPRRRRVWVLLAHFAQFDPETLLARLDHGHRCTVITRQPGALLGLCNLR